MNDAIYYRNIHALITNHPTAGQDTNLLRALADLIDETAARGKAAVAKEAVPAGAANDAVVAPVG